MTNHVELRNLTPHAPLNVWQEGVLVTSLPAAGPPARLEETWDDLPALSTADGPVPLVRMTYGDVAGLPDPERGVIHVVSQLVCRALPHRTDLVFPARLRRDAAGTIVGCDALARPADAPFD